MENKITVEKKTQLVGKWIHNVADQNKREKIKLLSEYFGIPKKEISENYSEFFSRFYNSGFFKKTATKMREKRETRAKNMKFVSEQKKWKMKRERFFERQKILATARPLGGGYFLRMVKYTEYDEQTSYQSRHHYEPAHRRVLRVDIFETKKFSIVKKMDYTYQKAPLVKKTEKLINLFMENPVKNLRDFNYPYDWGEGFFYKKGDKTNNYEVTPWEISPQQLSKEMRKREVEKLHKIREAGILAEADKIFVSFEDSTLAGNCLSGTGKFVDEFFPNALHRPGVRVRGSYILLMRDDEYTRRAVVAAGLRQGL